MNGQCTWFAWGKFYDIYGKDPHFGDGNGYYGNGYECVDYMLSNPELSKEFDRVTIQELMNGEKTISPGAVFSSDYAHNHVGVIVGVEDDRILVVQEGNYAGLRFAQNEYTYEEFNNSFGDAVFATPKEEPILF